MITVILESPTRQEIARCSKAGNESFLIRGKDSFRILALLNGVDYDVFDHRDMPELIGELVALRESVSDDEQVHIDDIVRLATLCRDEKGATLTFTPFE